MLEHTNRVTIELSDLCNYSAMHRGLCPNSTVSKHRILPLNIIKSVVNELKEMNWGEGKTICFHVYNEPLIDPRLYWLLEYVTKLLPGVKPTILTNGWFLNKEVVQELFDFGLFCMLVTLYSKVEGKRLLSELGLMRKRLNLKLMWANLTPNLMNPTPKRRHKQCHAPLRDLVIRASGNIGLCCLDWNETEVFGNLREDSLTVILTRAYDRMKEIQQQLSTRQRTLPVCKSCNSGRRVDK